MAIFVGPRVTDISNATTVSIANTYYKVHTFSTPGTTSFTPKGSGFIDVLIVGGGGGSGADNTSWDGGGGGGSVLYQKNVPVIGGVSYPITIGGPGASAVNTPFGFGGNSILSYNGGTITAPGGAFAANRGSNPSAAGNNPLGSGGGGARGPIAGGAGANIFGYGFPGGNGGPGTGGGGGGAGGAGSPSNDGGRGGPGVPYSITGSPVFYGGGGGPGTSQLHPTSFPTMFGLGGTAPNIPSRPGVIIITYISN